MVTFVKTKSGLQVYNEKGKVFSVSTDHPFFIPIQKCVLEPNSTFKDFNELYEAKKSSNVLKIALGENLEVTSEEDMLTATYKGLVLPANLQKRLITTIGKTYSTIYPDVESFRNLSEYDVPEEMNPMINFIENLMQNPAKSAVDELYGFLEDCSLPLTLDGCFLAYKKVAYNYTDIYSGKFSNKVGEELEMERWEVDDNRHQTCSTGFHCCSFDYLSHYGSESKDSHRIVVVKVNPKDVVSVPVDYHNQKMRVCKYTVVDEIPSASMGRIAEWYVPPVLEGHTHELVEGMIDALKMIGEKLKLEYLEREANLGINFDNDLSLTIPAEKMFIEEIMKMLSRLDANTEMLDFDEYIEEACGEMTINSLINFINARVY